MALHIRIHQNHDEQFRFVRITVTSIQYLLLFKQMK